MKRILVVLVLFLGLIGTVPTWSAAAASCGLVDCPTPEPTVRLDPGKVAADYFEVRNGAGYAGMAREPSPYRWRLLSQCDVTDAAVGACMGGQRDCPEPPGRLLAFYVVQRQRLTPPDRSAVDGQAPPPDFPVGTPFGNWTSVYTGCVDVTDLNPAPTPDEVYRYFRTLPLPALPTIQQPPGTALVGLPVVFHTDGPTTQTYDLTIRGFAVHITATATTYTWHTGDGTDLTTTSPGAPWPDTTATHTYHSGTYTSSLTTTWTATFTLDNGLPTSVPGTTTTTGPTTTFTVVQAHPVLTNPYD